MKLPKLGLGLVSVLVIFACAAAVISIRHGYRHPDRLVKVVNAAAAGTRVNGSQPRVPTPHLRLSGDVIELAQGAPLTVTATVGAATFPATVQGNTYTVDIGQPEAHQMVTVEATSPRVHYRTVVGSAGRLKALAGGDWHLTRAEQPSLRVSPYSTALGWLVHVALGDRDATSDAEFEVMTRVAASSDLEYAAYALAAFAKDELPLPAQFAGYTDGYQLLRDRDAFSQFIGYNNFRGVSAGYLFDQPQETVLTSLEALPNQLAFVGGMPRDQLPLHGHGGVFLLSRRGDGRFNLNELLPILDPINTVAVDGQGRIQLTPVGSQVRVVQKLGEYNQYYWFDRTAAGRTLKRLTRGDATSVWVMRSVWNDRDQLNPSAPIQQEVEYHVLSSTELSAWAVQDGWSSVAASTMTLPWMCAETPSPEETVYDFSTCGYAEHQFDIGGSGSTLNQGWKVDAQTMLPAPARSVPFSWLHGAQGALDLTDGKVATSFWRLKDYPADIGPVFFHSKALTGAWAGKTKVGISIATRKSMTSWPAGATTGNWRASLPDVSSHWYTTTNYDTLVERNAGGTGQDTFATNNPLPFAWQAMENAVYDKRIRVFYFSYDPSKPPYVDSCEAAVANGASDCHTRVRYFKPISRVGNRYYGIEERYEHTFYAADEDAGIPEEESWSYRRSSELVYYDCTSGACTSASAISATQGVRIRHAAGARLPGVTPASKQPRARRSPNRLN